MVQRRGWERGGGARAGSQGSSNVPTMPLHRDDAGGGRVPRRSAAGRLSRDLPAPLRPRSRADRAPHGRWPWRRSAPEPASRGLPGPGRRATASARTRTARARRRPPGRSLGDQVFAKVEPWVLRRDRRAVQHHDQAGLGAGHDLHNCGRDRAARRAGRLPSAGPLGTAVGRVRRCQDVPHLVRWADQGDRPGRGGSPVPGDPAGLMALPVTGTSLVRTSRRRPARREG